MRTSKHPKANKEQASGAGSAERGVHFVSITCCGQLAKKRLCLCECDLKSRATLKALGSKNAVPSTGWRNGKRGTVIEFWKWRPKAAWRLRGMLVDIGEDFWTIGHWEMALEALRRTMKKGGTQKPSVDSE